MGHGFQGIPFLQPGDYFQRIAMGASPGTIGDRSKEGIQARQAFDRLEKGRPFCPPLGGEKFQRYKRIAMLEFVDDFHNSPARSCESTSGILQTKGIYMKSEAKSKGRFTVLFLL